MIEHSLSRLGASLITAFALGACGVPDTAQQLEAARTALAGSDVRTAIIHLKSALQADPDSAEARFVYGNVLLDGDDPLAAAGQLDRAHELGFDLDRTTPLLVRALAQSGRATEATLRFDKAVLSNPEAQAELHVALSMAWDILGQRDRVHAAIEQALAAQPRHIEARVLAARLELGLGRFEPAWERIEEVLQDDPGDAGALQTKGLLLRYWKDAPAEALAVQRKALERNPGLLAAHTQLMSMLFEARDLPGMRAQLEAMASALPGNINTFFASAQLDYLEGNLQRARQTTAAIVKAEPENARFLSFSGLLDFRLGALNAAETTLAYAIRQAPDDEWPRTLLATIYLKRGKHERAMDVLLPALAARAPSAQVLGLAAEVSLSMGELQRAERYFARATQLHADSPRIQSALAVRSIGQGRVEEGFSTLEALSARNGDTYADMALITSHLRLGDRAAALAATETLRKKLPLDPAPLNLRGSILAQAGDTAQARLSHEQALALEPHNLRAALALVKLDLAAQQVDQAVQRLEVLVAATPMSVPAAVALAKLYTQTGEPASKAEAVLARGLKANPDDVDAHIALVDHLIAARQPDRAVAVAQEGSAAFPNQATMFYALGRAQIAAGSTEQALGSFRNIAPHAPGSALTHLAMAQGLAAVGDLKGATESLQRALAIAPDAVDALRLEVALALSRRDFERATAAARRLQAGAGDSAIGYELAGDIEMAQQRWQAAGAAYESAMARTAASAPGIKRHVALLNSGATAEADRFAARWIEARPRDILFLTHAADVEAARKNWPQAEQTYRRIIDLDASQASAHNNIAWALLQQGKPGAVAFAEKATALEPKQPRFTDTLATALAAQGDVQRALQAQQSAVQADPNSPTLKLTLARIALQAGDKALARQVLAELSKLPPGGREAAEVQRLLKQAS